MRFFLGFALVWEAGTEGGVTIYPSDTIYWFWSCSFFLLWPCIGNRRSWGIRKKVCRPTIRLRIQSTHFLPFRIMLSQFWPSYACYAAEKVQPCCFYGHKSPIMLRLQQGAKWGFHQTRSQQKKRATHKTIAHCCVTDLSPSPAGLGIPRGKLNTSHPTCRRNVGQTPNDIYCFFFSL